MYPICSRYCKICRYALIPGLVILMYYMWYIIIKTQIRTNVDQAEFGLHEPVTDSEFSVEVGGGSADLVKGGGRSLRRRLCFENCVCAKRK